MASKKPKDKILVLCIDRDNDVGRKGGISGPIIGRDKVLDAANRLGLADPEDADFNTMFKAIKTFDEIKKQNKAQIAVLTGKSDRGVASDMEIGAQLKRVLKSCAADGVVIVSDGIGDEHVIPLIQSSIPILSIQRVIVKQSEKLESTYYKVKDFIEETLDNPKMSRLILGLPAILLILLAIFGLEGGRIVIGLVGLYLIIKGFKLDNYVNSLIAEFKTSLIERRLAFFTYVLGIIFVLLATYNGYTEILTFTASGLFEVSSTFIKGSVFYYFLAGAMSWIGHALTLKKRWRTIVSVPVFGFAVSLVVYNAADLILKTELSSTYFILSVVAGFALMLIAILIEWVPRR